MITIKYLLWGDFFRKEYISKCKTIREALNDFLEWAKSKNEKIRFIKIIKQGEENE